jgi:hypothetical protein
MRKLSTVASCTHDCQPDCQLFKGFSRLAVLPTMRLPEHLRQGPVRMGSTCFCQE